MEINYIFQNEKQLEQRFDKCWIVTSASTYNLSDMLFQLKYVKKIWTCSLNREEYFNSLLT